MIHDEIPKRRRTEAPLLSTTTILILSGLLIGLSIAKPLDGLTFYIQTCGVAGIVSFYALKLIAVQREKLHQQREQQQMEQRLQRHVSIITPASRAEMDECVRLLEILESEAELLLR